MPLFDVTGSGGTVTTTGLVTYVGNVLTSLLSWVSSVFTTMVSSPIVMFFVILAIIGAVVAYARKILM